MPPPLRRDRPPPHDAPTQMLPSDGSRPMADRCLSTSPEPAPMRPSTVPFASTRTRPLPNELSHTVPSPATTAPEMLSGTRSAGVEYSRSEEHTSELQSRQYLVCRLLLE